MVQRQVLYLGEINDSQHEAWCRQIEAFDEGTHRHTQLALFPAGRAIPEHARAHGVQVRLEAMQLHRPRQWGACWLACETLRTARAQRLLGRPFAKLARKNALYRCLDKLLMHKPALFSYLQRRWADLFGAKFDVLLYDLTSSYFESSPPQDDEDKRRFGHSRDKRSDCVQVVIALIVTPEGFPIAYEVLPGNTSDRTTLRDMLRKIEAQYGKANRTWVMDRGIPTEEVLAEMRAAEPPVSYLVGTPKGRLTKLEKALLERPWQAVREGIDVKLLPQGEELYVFAQSRSRIDKERAMRRRQLKWLWARLKDIAAMDIDREELLMKLGAARAKARAAWRLIDIEVAPNLATFKFALNRNKLRKVWRREGRYLLRSNLCGHDPAQLWQFYIQLAEIEAAFKTMKDDLNLRPIHHQLEDRIEAHIFVAFLAYCLHVTLRARLKPLAPGLTPRAVLDKLAAVQMLDVHFPTTDGRTLVMSRYTELNADQKLLIKQLRLNLPSQPPPRITPAATALPRQTAHAP